uniref:NADH-ubiquinone oxidoreductase chain 3 n=1 Tax=Phloeotribus sp. BMNH 1047247 TaxID=1903799 RepID=A0A343A5H6_9CUCU|nr:NADH dehydrogenase subunit 3 [Phloeotribus sp. BMNH 1047247]
MILFLMTFILLLSMFLMLMLFFISKKTIIDREKTSPFECGFDPKNSARLPFSLHFFLIAIIFIIFDVELTLLLPLILFIKMFNIWTLFLTMSFFIMILLIGIYHEISEGSLNWVK